MEAFSGPFSIDRDMSFAKEVLTLPIKDWNKIGLLLGSFLVVLNLITHVVLSDKNQQSSNVQNDEHDQHNLGLPF